MSAQRTPGRLAYAGEEIFVQTLCEQVDGVYRTYRLGQLDLNRGIQQALEHVNRLLLDVRPEKVGALTALRARIAYAQSDEMLAVLEQFNGGLSHSPFRELSTALGPSNHPELPASGPTSASPTRTRPAIGKAWWAVAAAVLAFLGYATFGGSGSASRGSLVAATGPSGPVAPSSGLPRTLSGHVVIVTYSEKERISYSRGVTVARACEGAGGYSDMRPGQTVTVADASGRPLASGRLGPGTATSIGTGASTKQACAFTIDVPKVPNSPMYRLSFGARGPVVYSFQQLAASDWSPSVTLGP